MTRSCGRFGHDVAEGTGRSGKWRESVSAGLGCESGRTREETRRHTPPASHYALVSFRVRSGGAVERDDGQMHSPAMKADIEINDDSRTPSNEDVRSRAGRASRPSSTRFQAGTSAGWSTSEVDLVRVPRRERLVWPFTVVPSCEDRQFTLEVHHAEGDEDFPRAFVLHRPDESLDDQDAAVLEVEARRPVRRDGSLDRVMSTRRALAASDCNE